MLYVATLLHLDRRVYEQVNATVKLRADRSFLKYFAPQLRVCGETTTALVRLLDFFVSILSLICVTVQFAF